MSYPTMIKGHQPGLFDLYYTWVCTEGVLRCDDLSTHLDWGVINSEFFDKFFNDNRSKYDWMESCVEGFSVAVRDTLFHEVALKCRVTAEVIDFTLDPHDFYVIHLSEF